MSANRVKAAALIAAQVVPEIHGAHAPAQDSPGMPHARRQASSWQARPATTNKTPRLRRWHAVLIFIDGPLNRPDLGEGRPAEKAVSAGGGGVTPGRAAPGGFGRPPFWPF